MSIKPNKHYVPDVPVDSYVIETEALVLDPATRAGRKDTSITMRINMGDLYLIKQAAAQLGISKYQRWVTDTLIQQAKAVLGRDQSDLKDKPA
jgi:hypothetical protein